ncbi:MAG TPA: hypothetical protein VFQ44_29505 [Streptosporangiaceae bacterium]|nr:hypothetical protein [Streptosporangiaceae bacterium]
MPDPLTVVFDAFAEVMGEHAPRGADTVPADVEMWTSLTHVYLVAEIESRLEVRLPQALITPGAPLGAIAQAATAAIG